MALIATYVSKLLDSGVARYVAQLIADGADLQALRSDFARAAGIGRLSPDKSLGCVRKFNMK